jgi:hypothetical protein
MTAAVAAMGLCIAFAGSAIAFGAIDDLAVLEKALIGGICWTIPLYVFFRTVKGAKTSEIHISGAGQVRVRVIPQGGVVADRNGAEGSANQHGELVQLLSVSTLWPWLMVLHFRHEDGRKSTLTILPDAVGEASFRALKVACGWIVMRRAEDPC